MKNRHENGKQTKGFFCWIILFLTFNLSLFLQHETWDLFNVKYVSMFSTNISFLNGIRTLQQRRSERISKTSSFFMSLNIYCYPLYYVSVVVVAICVLCYQHIIWHVIVAIFTSLFFLSRENNESLIWWWIDFKWSEWSDSCANED